MSILYRVRRLRNCLFARKVSLQGLVRSRDEVETQNNLYIELIRKIMSCSSENIDKTFHPNGEKKSQKKNEQKDTHKTREDNKNKVNIMRSAGCDWNVEDFEYFMSK